MAGQWKRNERKRYDIESFVLLLLGDWNLDRRQLHMYVVDEFLLEYGR
jgi:hypothetical protein